MLRPIDRWLIDRVLPSEPRFLQVARRMTSDGGEAEDLVQEAYVELLGRADWESIGDVPAYTIGIIRNRAISRMRRAKIVQFRHLTAADSETLASTDPDAFRSTSGKNELARADAALAAMPERCRDVVLRCRIQEESPSLVAASLGLSLSTLEKRLARGLHLLTRALARHEPSDAPDPQQAAGQAPSVPPQRDAHVQRSARG